MRRLLNILAAAAIILSVFSCTKEEVRFSGTYSDVFIYYGAGYNNLSYSLKTNLMQLSKGELPAISSDKAVVAFIHNTAGSGNYSTPNSPQLIQFYTKNGNIVIDTLKTYDAAFVSASKERLHEVLTDIEELFPSKSYGFLFSSHGTGWLPAHIVYHTTTSAASASSSEAGEALPAGAGRREWHPDPSLPETKSIGADYYYRSSNTYEIDLADFVEAIPMKMKYIILDACLCGGIEDAYQFRNVCDYLVAAPTETLTSGLVVYTSLMSRLFKSGGPDLKGVCEDFISYTESRTGSLQSGTITLVDNSKLTDIATFCKTFFAAHRDDMQSARPYVQKYFYDSKEWFYDLRDFIAKMGATESELSEFDALLSKAVLYHGETEYFFTVKLERCCGLSVYIPYTNATTANAGYRDLDWNKATGLVE